MELKHHPAKVGRSDIVRLPPTAIKIDPAHNIRDMQSERTRAHIEELKIAIKAWGGIKDPFEVRIIGEDAYVTDGECRLTAVLELMRDEGFECEGISCIKEAAGTDAIERALNFGISGTKERYTELELAEWCRRCDRLGTSHERIAAAAGWKSTASVKRHLDMISTLPEEVKQQVKQGDVSATLAMQIVKETRDAKKDPEFAAELIRANKEQNERIRGKKKRSTKVTAKTIKRDKEKGKPPQQPEPKVIGYVPSDQTLKALGAELVSDTTKSAPALAGNAAMVAPDDSLPSALAATQNQIPQRNGVKELIEALKPFADLCNDIDLNQLRDDEVIEVFARDVKRAWTVYTAATGGEQG